MGRGPVSVEPGGMYCASFQLLGGERLEIRDESRYRQSPVDDMVFKHI